MSLRRAWALMVCLLASQPSVHAADSQWQENEPASAPVFQTDRLLRFDVSANSEMKFGIDPTTLTLGSDGVVRYVMVVTSPSGAINASFDGIHCSRGEFKNYARWSPGSADAGGHWVMAERPEWRSLFSGYATRAALQLARTAFCDGTATNGKPDKMLRDLRQGR